MSVGAPPADRLPDGFAVRLDPAVQRRDDGASLLGGSPLRLLRLAPRARALLAGDRLVVRDVTSAALAARLLDAGMAAPDLDARAPDDVTVVIPVRDRTASLARLLAALRADPSTAGVPVLVVDDGSADPGAVAAVAAACAADVLRQAPARGPAAARNAGLREAATATVAFVDSDCVPRRGWLDALAPHLADPRLALVAPRIVGLPPERPTWLTPYESAVSALDMGGRPAAVRPLSAVSYVPSAALLVRRAALGGGFDESMQVAEDVDLVWRLTGAGWRVRYEPAAEVAHEHPSAAAAWLRRRAFYGTGAAPLAARHGRAVAPLVISPWSAAAWGLLLSGRRRLVPAVAVLAAASARLTRRLSRPGEAPPALFATGLVLRGTATAGTTLARAVTRHHWPLAVPAAVLSRRARRLVLAAAVGDAAVAWWPHRRAVGPLRFAAARRLEDLAYGAGLWAGALRARDPRALLPAAPPTFDAVRARRRPGAPRR
ncbi:mycofactocin biosynthesis glycosyltransferase MftF [Geodermatophilus sp. URMC 64]